MTNAGPGPTFYDRCSTRLEHRVHGTWRTAYSAIYPQSGPTPDTVPAGGAITGTFPMVVCRLDNCLPRLDSDPIAGVYRLAGDLFGSAEVRGGLVIPTDPLPAEANRSNEFWLDPP